MQYKRDFLVIPFIVLVASCSSAPPPRETKPAVPGWTLGPPRALEGDHLTYIGIGEDREAVNAKTKAQAIALQDLANDCSVIPQETEILDTFDETAGVLYRSYAKITIGLQECQKAKVAQSASEISAIAQPQMTAQVKHYQKLYDAPEPDEARPLQDLDAISDSGKLFVVRQQLAFAKQQTPSAGAKMIPITIRLVAGFERAHPEIWNSTQAFSNNRPNAINHQASAVRDTIEERAQIRKEYPQSPPVITPSKGGKTDSGGRGRHRRQSQPRSESSDNNSGGL